MAGSDCKVDAIHTIANYIEREVRNLLEGDMNDFDDPAWAQAAELFDEVVVPCKHYCSEGLFILGADIVKEAEGHGCRVAYQTVPGTYNEGLVSDYSRTVNSIKAWITRNEVSVLK